jgi:dienelactone hydrolase
MNSAPAAVVIVALLIGTLSIPGASQTHAAAARHSRASTSTARLTDGVVAKEVHFYSEGIQCYGRIFTPKGLSPESKAPAVVLAPGWGETAGSTEAYAMRFASRGLVAMVIDYRGWGKSGGFLQTVAPVKTDDRLRFSQMTARVRIRRRPLIPQHQILDIRNALYYLQGEPGVDRARVGLWGRGMAGGHVIVIAAIDARIRAAVAHAPVIEGKDAARKASAPTGELLKAEQRRARLVQSPSSNDAAGRSAYLETRAALAEYHPFWYVEQIPQTTAVLFVITDRESTVSNESNATNASKLIKGPTSVVSIPAIGMQVVGGAGFEAAANAAADWFLKHLGGS